MLKDLLGVLFWAYIFKVLESTRHLSVDVLLAFRVFSEKSGVILTDPSLYVI